MTDAEIAGLWIGIVAGLAGIVLSSVAIWFAWSVDERGKRVSDQTVKSLQKIETTVERLSEDTTGLIKAGWDRMLGQMGPAGQAQDAEKMIEGMVSGVQSELQARLAEVGTQPGDPDTVKKLLRDIEAPLASQIAALVHLGRPSQMIDHVLESLTSLSAEAQELARMLTRRHLTRQEYNELMATPLAEALAELRDEGLLVPLQGYSSTGEERPVYHFPPPIADVMNSALQLLPENPEAVSKEVYPRLRKIGYFVGAYP